MLCLLSLPAATGVRPSHAVACGWDLSAAALRPLYSARLQESDLDQRDDQGEPNDQEEARMRNEQKHTYQWE